MLAGALGVALACDLIIAKEGARFGTPEINVGVFPFMIMALIYRNVGRKKTNELLLLGEQIDAHEAERIGIVNKVVPAEEFDAAVADWAGPAGGQVAAADAAGQGRDVPPAGPRVRGRARVPARAASRSRSRPTTSRRASRRSSRSGSRCGPASERRRAALPDVGPHAGRRRAAPRRWRSRSTPTRALIGTPGEPRIANYDDDLRDSPGCLLEAGGQVEDMLDRRSASRC